MSIKEAGDRQNRGADMSSETKVKLESGEKIVMHAHCSHCGGTCLLKVHVKNGLITRIETDDGEEPQYRACARGRAMRQRVYAPDRILYPLKRVGERGENYGRLYFDKSALSYCRNMLIEYDY